MENMNWGMIVFVMLAAVAAAVGFEIRAYHKKMNKLMGSFGNVFKY